MIYRVHGADFVKHLVPSRRVRQNKALDPTALAGCPQASLLPSVVLAGQRRDSEPKDICVKKLLSTCY
jgi:hypothetical protein